MRGRPRRRLASAALDRASAENGRWPVRRRLQSSSVRWRRPRRSAPTTIYANDALAGLDRPHHVHDVDCVRRAEAHERQHRTRGLFPRQAKHSMVGGGPVGDGDATERHHHDWHDGAGLHGRDAIHPVLLRPAAGDGNPFGDAGPVFLQLRRLHRLRVSREALRCKDAESHERAVPALARHVVRRGCRRARRGPVADPRSWRHDDVAADHDAGGSLHDVRRRAGRDVDRRQDHGPDRRSACSR